MRLISVLIHIALTALVLWSMPIVPSAVQAPLQPLASATTRMVGADGVEIRVRTMGLGHAQALSASGRVRGWCLCAARNLGHGSR